MADGWYFKIKRSEPLVQGELIVQYPLPVYSRAVGVSPRADVIIMTHACDLANNKVGTVLVCPVLPLTEYYGYWRDDMAAKGNNVTSKSWTKHCESLIEGDYNNLLVLNSGEVGKEKIEVRLVDFGEVYTLPKFALEAVVKKSKTARYALRPPYREYVSQAFARLFMRVALPLAVPREVATAILQEANCST